MRTFREFAARLAAAALVLMLVSSLPLDAQVTTGAIVGTVSDANGVVPGATVTIRETGKNTTATFVTDTTGTYAAPFLVPGTYAIEVHVQGFKRWLRDGIILQVNQRACSRSAASACPGLTLAPPCRRLQGSA